LFSHSSLKFYFIFLVCLPCPFDMSALVYMWFPDWHVRPRISRLVLL
jgi:hypothetical protein